MTASMRRAPRFRPDAAAWVALAVVATAGVARATSPTVVAVGRGAAAPVAVVSEHRFPGMQHDRVLRARRHDGAAPAQAVPLHCTFAPFAAPLAATVRGVRRHGDAVRIGPGDPDTCTPARPGRAVLAGQSVVLDFSPARAVAAR